MDKSPDVVEDHRDREAHACQECDGKILHQQLLRGQEHIAVPVCPSDIGEQLHQIGSKMQARKGGDDQADDADHQPVAQLLQMSGQGHELPVLSLRAFLFVLLLFHHASVVSFSSSSSEDMPDRKFLMLLPRILLSLGICVGPKISMAIAKTISNSWVPIFMIDPPAYDDLR